MVPGGINDWQGSYRIVNENGRMVLVGDYIYYPVNNPTYVKRVQKSFYIS